MKYKALILVQFIAATSAFCVSATKGTPSRAPASHGGLPTDAYEGSHNGPSFSGQAIPIHLDRGITFDDVQKAYEVCLVKGRSNPEVLSEMQKLFKRMNRDGEITKKPVYIRSYPTKASLNPNSLTPGKGMIDPHLYAIVSTNAQTSEKFPQFEHDGVIVILQSHNVYFHVNGPGIALKLSDSLPRVVYAGATGDRFGRLDTSKAILKDLRIEMPVSPLSMPEFIPYISEPEGLKTAFSFNVREYVECLIGEMSRMDTGR